MSIATRDPASITKTGTEVALLTPVGMIVAYIVVKFDPAMPPEIQQAIVGFVIALGTMWMSHRRNVQHEA